MKHTHTHRHTRAHTNTHSGTHRQTDRYSKSDIETVFVAGAQLLRGLQQPKRERGKRGVEGVWGRRKECGRRQLILQLFGAHNKVDTPPRHFEYFARKPQKVGNEFACLASSAIMCTLCACVCVCVN